MATVRDSAGVIIVENPPIPPDAGEWHLGPEPMVEIGVLDGDAAYQLFRVRDAARLADGRVAVVDGGTNELRVYGADGGHLATWGGEGEGPGEFLLMQTLVRWPGDSLAVWDGRTRRITLYSEEGDLGRSFPLPGIGSTDFPEFAGVLASGDLVLSGQAFFGDDGAPPASGVRRIPVHVAVVDAAGAPVGDVGIHPGQETYIQFGESTIEVLRMEHARGYVLAPAGGEVIMAPNERFELRFWSPDGSLARLVRLTEPPRPLTDAVWEAELQRRLEEVPDRARPRIRAMWDLVPRPDTLPAMSAVLPDAAGHLWIRSFTFPAVDASARWIVLDPSGQAVASLDLPAGMEVYEIGTDYLVGMVRDDLDVERVQVWPLRRGP